MTQLGYCPVCGHDAATEHCDHCGKVTASSASRPVRKKVIAVLDSMYDWRGLTSGAGYRRAPRCWRD